MRKTEPVRSLEERNVLVLQWQGLVKRVCKDLARKMPRLRMRLGCEDAEQIGFLGLIRAAELWKDEAMMAAEGGKPVAFKTYAYRAVQTHIYRAVHQVPSLVRPPHHGRDIDKFRDQHEAAFRSGAVGGSLAENAIERFLDGRAEKLYAPSSTRSEKKAEVVAALKSLSKRAARILWWRYGMGVSFRDIALRLGVNVRGVHAIAKNALGSLRERQAASERRRSA
jgi:RNA polymerase sigma factor (sigma-70 family)